MSATRSRFAKPLAFAAATIVFLLTAALLSAHDFWLVPDAFQITPGGTLEVRGQTSSKFPTSEAAVALDRIAEARVIGTSSEAAVTDLSHSGKSLLLRHRPATAGQRIVAVVVKPRSVRESAQGFKRYMVLEGAPQLAERYEREGLLPKTDSITRRYAKYAKTVIEVGRGGPRAFGRVAGHPAEFVPLNDPAALRAGDTLAVRLLYRGQPLANAHVHAGAATAASSHDGAQKDLSLVTDANGIAHVAVGENGLWNVRTIHIVPATRGSGADWDVHWATLVFRVGSDAGGSAPAAGATPGATDSADVVVVIERYHKALVAGDSAAALALLAPDAVILESGGVESREEYRGHHLPADISFARAVPSSRGKVSVVVRGDVAWASSTSTTQGKYRDRQINAAGAELMVLSREADGWKIRAIHWSSRNRRP
ncbi:MAG: DUF4198 domain-containing protein [Gemmatimonadaceae bacterium]